MDVHPHDAHGLSTEWDHLLARQEDLENTGLAKGATRFRKRLLQAQENDTLSTIGAGKRLLTAGLDPLEATLTAFLVLAKGKRGTRHVAVRWIEEIGVSATAYMALKCVLDTIDETVPLTTLARSIADLMMDELRYRRFRELAPALFDYKMNRFTTSSYSYMARSLDASIRFLRCVACQQQCEPLTLEERKAFICPHLSGRFEDLELSSSHRILLGTKLIDLVMTATGLIEVQNTGPTTRHGPRLSSADSGIESARAKVARARGRAGSVRSSLQVRATAETQAWLNTRNDLMELLAPVVTPMVVPPLQWAPGQRGGYRYGLRNKFSLVRGTYHHVAETIAHTEMPKVYQALNAIQNTAWRINESVVSLCASIAAQGGCLGGLPAMDPESEIARPLDIDTNPESKRQWKKLAHERIRRNVQRGVKAREYERVMSVANSLRHEQAIFFPHNLDFRGRIYPVTAFLTPQGDDLSKALLTFAQGKPIGEDGFRWLCIHGANKMDMTPEGQKVSKMTLNERVAWIKANERNIINSALYPLQHTWWAQADKPLQFYAFCTEYARVFEGGLDTVVSLPVSIDGTCNGLQHFSAMLRDPIGGKAVNVMPNDVPQDVYQQVAEHCLTALEDLAPHSEMARRWLQSGIVNRKLVKRPTMTYVYGSKVFGFQAQLLEYVQGLENAREIATLFEDVDSAGAVTPQLMQACSEMADLIWGALHEITVAAAEGMAWLQYAARAIVKSNQPVRWSVPATGFPVRQQYFVMKERRIDTILAGHVIRPALYSATTAIEAYKQTNAIAPNVVHSLDAAALMLTVSRASDEGVEAFAAIHDSYGTVPADMSVMARATRESFVALYTDHNVIGELYSQFTTQVPDGTILAPPPTPGALDVSAVLASDYFFC